jgi:DNA-binding GntR family transcriptional regulator
VPKKPTTTQIYQRLHAMITDFKLLPGSRITETELANLFKVSRTPIREALHRLEVENLLEIRSKQGCFIRAIDMEEINHYYDVRVGLEAVAVELSCPRIPIKVVETLARFWNPKQARKQAKDLESLRDAEETFHVSIAEHCGNPVLLGYLREVNDRIRVIRRLAFIDQSTINETFDDHHRICRMLLSGNIDDARDALIKHIRKSQSTSQKVTLAQLQNHYGKKPRALPRKRSTKP